MSRAPWPAIVRRVSRKIPSATCGCGSDCKFCIPLSRKGAAPARPTGTWLQLRESEHAIAHRADAAGDHTICLAEKFGGKGIRTPDIQLAKLALYQLSYAPVLNADFRVPGADCKRKSGLRTLGSESRYAPRFISLSRKTKNAGPRGGRGPAFLCVSNQTKTELCATVSCFSEPQRVSLLRA